MDIARRFVDKARGLGARIVFPEPGDERIRKAAAQVADRGIARPVLVGRAEEMPDDVPAGVEVEVIDGSARMAEFTERYVQKRGARARVARRMVERPLVYGGMMVECGAADGMVAGLGSTTAQVVTAAGLSVGYADGVSGPCGCMLMCLPEVTGRKDVVQVWADCAVNVEPDPETLAEIAELSAGLARRLLDEEPRVAFLCFSTAGSGSHPSLERIREGVRLARERVADGVVEGEMQLDAALVPPIAARKFDGENPVAGRANVLVFPDLNAANIAYKAAQHLGGALALGPLLRGLGGPVNDLSRGASVEDAVLTTAITVIEAAGGRTADDV